jgi:hypothetical protein
MGAREFHISLIEEAHIAVEFMTFKGEVVCFVVRLMMKMGSGNVCIARYDTAHGRPHLDRVNARGRLIEKEWLLGISFSDALCYAINDFRLNYETYISQFKNASTQ